MRQVNEDTWEEFVDKPDVASSLERAIHQLICHLTKDEEIRENTPRRWVWAMNEMLSGTVDHPSSILSKTFPPEDPDVGIVLVDKLAFTSICAHHLLPFHGMADIAYIPKDKVVGLSKIARLLECRSRRLQMQETLGAQIANDMMEHLEPLGVAVRLVAQHDCMTCRGVRSNGRMVTSVMRGCFLDEGKARGELMMLLGRS